MLLADTMNRVFDFLFAPFGGSAAWAMVVLAVVTAAWALLLFRRATDRRRLAAARRRLLGHIYELGLYQTRLAGLVRIQRDVAVANLRYLALSLPALLVLAVPMVLTVVQLEARLAHRPFQRGESTLVTATVVPADRGRLDRLRLETPAGVTATAPPVRDARTGTVTWRVRVDAPGRHALAVHGPDGGSRTKTLIAGGDGLPRLAAVREKPGFHHAFLNPAEPPLERGAPVQAIALQLPDRDTRYLGVRLPWLGAFVLFSLLGGLALVRVLRVSF